MCRVLIVMHRFYACGMLLGAYSRLDNVLSTPEACTESWWGAIVTFHSSVGGHSSSPMTHARLKGYSLIV